MENDDDDDDDCEASPQSSSSSPTSASIASSSTNPSACVFVRFIFFPDTTPSGCFRLDLPELAAGGGWVKADEDDDDDVEVLDGRVVDSGWLEALLVVASWSFLRMTACFFYETVIY